MGIILGDSGTLQSISYGGGMIGEWGESKLLKSFTYTGSDQVYTIPEDGKYTFKVKGAGSNNAKGGYAEGTFTLSKGTKISVMVGQDGGSQSSATYGFGGSGNYGSDRAGGGLSGVFTGDSTITASDSARAMIIAGGAGGGKASGGAGGGETGGNGTKGSYGTAGGGGTQTGRNSGGNTGANQFNGGNGSGTYGSGGGGGWYGGNSSVGDTSQDDDSGSGGGSGYVLSTAEGRVLTQGGGANSGSNGSIEMYQSVKVYKGNVKKVMLGEVQVWPEVQPDPKLHTFDIDFTTGLHGFTYYGKTESAVSYGNDSNGLYATSSNTLYAAAWKMTSDIRQSGDLVRAEVRIYSTSTSCGGGLAYGVDTKVLRCWHSIQANWGSGDRELSYSVPSGDKTFIIDFENKTIGFEWKTQTLTDTEISNFLAAWRAGNVNVTAIGHTSGTKAYVKGVKFITRES